MNQQPGPDRNALVGIVLISLIFGLWMLFFSPRPEPQPAAEPQAGAVEQEAAPEERAVEALETPTDSLFAAAVRGPERLVTVETDRYVATFSTRGGTPVSFRLKGYRQADRTAPVELVQNREEGALALGFNPPRGGFVDTRTLAFRPTVGARPFEGDTLRVGEGGAALAFDAPVGGGGLRLAYGFRPDSYEVTLDVSTPGTDVLAQSGGYELVWDGAVPFAENDHQQEATQSGAYVRWGGETSRLKLDGDAAPEPVTAPGDVDWVAVKTKYFIAALVPAEGEETEGAELEGRRTGELADPTTALDFTARLQLPRPDADEADRFRLYLGPMELQRLGAYGLYDTVEFGFGQSLTRPIARYVIAPTLALLTAVVPSYGLAILLFALVVKLVLWPLTAQSFKSAARMRELQPKVEALKEKYGDNPQKQQEEMMRLYKEAGVNPLGGCLPMLLQYPILIALWQFFQSTLVLRQHGFLWANDLSAPDVILRLPFSIPLYGDFVAGFTLLMGVSMIFQMRLASPPGGMAGQQKVLLYMMPAVFFLFFNRLPAGLSLYYLAFNVFSILQQQWTNRRQKPEGVAEAQTDRKKIHPAGLATRHADAATSRARKNGRATTPKKAGR